MSCKNIVVSIKDFEYGNTYIVFLRNKKSSAEFGSLPAYTKTTNTSQVIFKNVPLEEYEVGIKKDCGDDNQSIIIWSDVISKTCPVPTVVLDGTDLKISTGVLSAGYEYRIDENNWVEVATNGTGEFVLSISDLNNTHDAYATTMGNGILFDVQFRTVCALFNKSAIAHYVHSLGTEALPKVSLLKVLCEGGLYSGLLLRFSITTTSADMEAVNYADASTASVITLLEYQRTASLDNDIAYYKNFFNGYNSRRFIDPADFTNRIVSFDFLIKQPPLDIPDTGNIPCGDYPNPIEVIVAIP